MIFAESIASSAMHPLMARPPARNVVFADGLSKNYLIKNGREGFWGACVDLISPRFYRKQAVINFTMKLAQGECIGLIGPNGAGKSTIIKMLCGLQVPDKGDLTVLGHSPAERERAFYFSIGAVFGHKCSLWWDLPLKSSFIHHRELYNIPSNRFISNLNQLSRGLRLDDIMAQPVRSLSLGERVKAEVACALLHDPQLLLLDEPTVGLDISAKAELRAYLNKAKKEKGISILLTSHDSGDIQACSDRIVLVSKGEKKVDEDLSVFRSRVGAEMEVIVSDSLYLEKALEQPCVAEFMSKLDRNQKKRDELGRFKLIIKRGDLGFVINALTSFSGLTFEVRELSFEDALLRYYSLEEP